MKNLRQFVKSDATYTRTYLLMRKQCPMFMLFVSRIYSSYTRSYILMRKQCLIFMLLAASTAAYFCTSWTTNQMPLTQGLISWWENNASCLFIVSRIWAHWEKSIENKISKRYCWVVQTFIIGSLSTNVFETRTATGRVHFACKVRIVSQIVILLISNGEN